MPSSPSRIILSRFFNNNVKLVADMCTRCYEESEDVKIISVNINFLKQTDDIKYLVDTFDFRTVSLANFAIVESERKESELGFSRGESELSLKYTETLNELINTNKEAIKKIEDTFAREQRKDVFKGFSTDDVENSTKNQTNIIKARDVIRRKVYRRINMRTLKYRVSKSVHKNRSNENNKSKPTISKKSNKGNQIEHSKYFSMSFENNNINNVLIKEESENIKVEFKCEHCKIGHCACPENCVKLESIDYESQYFKTQPNREPLFRPKHIKSETGLKEDGFKDEVIDEKTTIFIPPKSPHNLIEEHLYHDPWALLVATIFLNRTSCMCARPHVFWFLKENPDPLVVLDKYPRELEKYFVNLGLQRTRAVQIWRMSHDFVYKKWSNVNELYGIGRYGEEAFRMFCLGDFSVVPKDRFLRIYKAWYEKVAMKDRLL